MSKRRIARLVLTVVLSFALCWFPLQAVFIIELFFAAFVRTHTILVFIAQVFGNCSAYANSCINPILYAFLSRNYRKGFVQTARDIIHCRRTRGLLIQYRRPYGPRNSRYPYSSCKRSSTSLAYLSKYRARSLTSEHCKTNTTRLSSLASAVKFSGVPKIFVQRSSLANSDLEIPCRRSASNAAEISAAKSRKKKPFCAVHSPQSISPDDPFSGIEVPRKHSDSFNSLSVSGASPSFNRKESSPPVYSTYLTEPEFFTRSGSKEKQKFHKRQDSPIERPKEIALKEDCVWRRNSKIRRKSSFSGESESEIELEILSPS